MSDLQIYQVLGLIFFIVGLGGLLRKDVLKKVLEDYAGSYGLIYLSGILTLFAGYVILVSHHSWAVGLPLVITLLGWAVFLKGAFLLLLPEYAMKLGKKCSKMKGLLLAFPVLALIAGALLLYVGFIR